MSYVLLGKDKLRPLLDELARFRTLVAPVREDGVVIFQRVQGEDAVALDYINPVTSVKDFFFPQTETLFRYRVGGSGLELEVEPPPEERVVFGVRPCDLASLEHLDLAFGGEQYQDSYYARRRQNTVLIGLACREVGPACFCTSFGINPGRSTGADLMLYEGEAGYLVAGVSDRGREVLAEHGSYWETAGDGAEELIRSYQEKEVPLGAATVLDGVSEKLDGMFFHPLWEDISRRCLNCGICTYVCPTCYCFSLDDEALGREGCRQRCWDSCMYPGYTLMAGGHNPRPTKVERVRQRFMHKLSYFVHQHGRYLCVGCGRCVEKCPVGLHMVQVISDVKGVSADGGE